MNTMQSMPDIWDNRSFWTSRRVILGALAAGAICQSLSIISSLPQALREFYEVYPATSHIFETNCHEISYLVKESFMKCPHILAWNHMDLDALATNIAHTVTVQEKYTRAQAHRNQARKLAQESNQKSNQESFGVQITHGVDALN